MMKRTAAAVCGAAVLAAGTAGRGAGETLVTLDVTGAGAKGDKDESKGADKSSAKNAGGKQ